MKGWKVRDEARWTRGDAAQSTVPADIADSKILLSVSSPPSRPRIAPSSFRRPEGSLVGGLWRRRDANQMPTRRDQRELASGLVTSHERGPRLYLNALSSGIRDDDEDGFFEAGTRARG